MPLFFQAELPKLNAELDFLDVGWHLSSCEPNTIRLQIAHRADRNHIRSYAWPNQRCAQKL